MHMDRCICLKRSPPRLQAQLRIHTAYWVSCKNNSLHTVFPEESKSCRAKALDPKSDACHGMCCSPTGKKVTWMMDRFQVPVLKIQQARGSPEHNEKHLPHRQICNDTSQSHRSSHLCRLTPSMNLKQGMLQRWRFWVISVDPKTQ